MIGLLHKVETIQAYTDINPLAGVLLVRVCLLCVSVSIVWAAGIFGLVPLRLLTPSWRILLKETPTTGLNWNRPASS